MKTLDEKLQSLQQKLLYSDDKIRIMIIGLGSVGLYLLDYLVSTADPRMEIIVAGRNYDKMLSDMNIVRTAATIRRQLRADIHIEGNCDLEDVESIAGILKKWNPDIIVNSSRVYSGLKYGSISWHNLRAYGIWTPLSIRYARNIMEAYEKCGCGAVSINTSYSDAVIPWLKSAGKAYFDFGSGNLNHLIPRMKFYVAEKFGIDNLNDIDITLAVSHFHDVVISKEGQPEGQDILLEVKYRGERLLIDKAELLKACMISMPVDQKRNMMNASSNFDIINSILTALDNRTKVKLHIPGFNGEIGGYPVIIDGSSIPAKAYADTSVFSLEDMRKANRESIYLDGILNVDNATLHYTPELVTKVKKAFDVNLPKEVHYDEIETVGKFIIENIIKPNLAK